MLKILLKKQLYELNYTFFYDRKRGKARSKATSITYIVLYALLMIVVIGGMFAGLSAMLCSPLTSIGLDWLYFDIMTLMALLFGVFGGVFNTYSSLYKAKDNDLMLSLPIPTRYILLSRLIGVYLMGLMFSASVMLPADIVYFIVAKPTFAGVFGSLLLTILVSVFVFILSCALGWVVAKVSSKLKSKSLIVVVLSLVFFGLYYFVCFNASELLQKLILNAAGIGESIKGSAYILYAVGRCGVGDWLSMLLLTLAMAVLFFATYFILARSFIKIATSPDTVAKREYRAQTVKMRSVSAALLWREFRRYLSSPTYILNCSLGTVFMIFVGVFLLINGGELTELVEYLPFADGFMPVMLTIFVCIISCMNDLTAPSVSLEGKSLWIAQTLPVAPKAVLWAKLKLHMLLTAVPELFLSACVGIVLKPDAALGALCLIFPVVFTLFNAALGLIINLKNPNFTWQTETAAVKQGASVMIALFGGWIIAALLAGCYYLLSSVLGAAAFLALASVLFGAASAWELKWLGTRGSEIFRHL